MTTIVYRQAFADPGLCVRPSQRFLEAVEVEGQTVYRFQFFAFQEKKEVVRVVVRTDGMFSGSMS